MTNVRKRFRPEQYTEEACSKEMNAACHRWLMKRDPVYRAQNETHPLKRMWSERRKKTAAQ